MHSKNLQAVGNALFNKDTSQCVAIAYGWKEKAKYDADGKIANPEALQPSDEAAANAKLWANAPYLLEALKEARRAIGDHFAPNDCYATGPLTGDSIRDTVQCPACSAIAMYDDAIAKATGIV